MNLDLIPVSNLWPLHPPIVTIDSLRPLTKMVRFPCTDRIHSQEATGVDPHAKSLPRNGPVS
jgi:hypothetical protein